MSTELLENVYPTNEIFVRKPIFSNREPAVRVTCCVPPGRGYATRPVPYVTAENYVRILSQASYLLAFRLIESGQVKVEVKPKEFLRAMVEYELYYRNLSMTFHRRVPRGERFDMELALSNLRQIKRLNQEFILFSFSNRNTAVLGGQMSFVYMGGKEDANRSASG